MIYLHAIVFLLTRVLLLSILYEISCRHENKIKGQASLSGGGRAAWPQRKPIGHLTSKSPQNSIQNERAAAKMKRRVLLLLQARTT